MGEAWNVLLVAILAQVSSDTGSCHPIETYGLLTLRTDDSVLLDKHLSQAARAHTQTFRLRRFFFCRGRCSELALLGVGPPAPAPAPAPAPVTACAEGAHAAAGCVPALSATEEAMMTSAARAAGNLLDGMAPQRKGSEPRLFDRDHNVTPG